jgi:GTP cyclohydrolase IA
VLKNYFNDRHVEKENNMSFNKTKCDPELGRRVHEHLMKMGVETPTIDTGLSRTDKIDIIETKFTDIMRTMGLDLSDDSLAETPTRVDILG